jgi:putative transcriptional regulator
MTRFTYDPNNPPKMSDEERARRAAMTDADIIAAAESDPDNRPMTDAEWARGRTRWLARKAREASGLSQAKFAEAFHLKVKTVQSWEAGRRVADEPARAYLKVIMREPALVRAALARPGDDLADLSNAG